MLKEGNEAPHFCLPNENNETISLKDFEGKWVVLYFYPKDQTPGCTKEDCDLTDSINLFNDLNAVVLGVSADSTESHKNFVQKQNISFPLLSDTNFNIIEAYGAKDRSSILSKLMNATKRMTYIIDPKGKVAHIWPKVKVSGHSFDVLHRLKDLIENKAE